MFDSRVAFHAYPDVPGYTHYDVDLVSSEMPSGASWLANCLLELGVPLWKPWGADTRADWQTCDHGRFRYTREDESWRRLLPGLRAQREFEFRAAPVPRLTHAWPGVYPAVQKTILFVRDPRDTLLSFWHRAKAVGLVAADQRFEEFVAAPWFHYPLGRGEFLRLWLRVWRLALQQREHLILRLEDYRHDAIGTLRRAVNFLGIATDDAALHAAAEASDFSVARAAEQTLIDAGTLQHVLIRAGRAQEWRSAYDASMHAAVGAGYADIYNWLGYAPDSSGLPPLAPQHAARVWIDRMLIAAQADQLPAEHAAHLRHWFELSSTDCNAR